MRDLNPADLPPAIRQPPGVLESLRHATRGQHQWLDAHLPLAHAGAGRAAYIQHLQMMQAWLQRVQPLLQQTGWGQACLGRVLRDLVQAGAAPHAPTTAAPAVPARDAAFAWGVAYVVEGSQLGGQVLYRRLKDALQPLTLDALRGLGAETGAHWKQFIQALHEAVHEPACIAAACEGACWAFSLLIQQQDKEPSR